MHIQYLEMERDRWKMKIVIDIPDFIYKQILKKHVSKETIARIFSNGTPLPKGCGRLIDANKVDTAIYECFDGIQFYDGTGYDIYQEAKESIDKIHPIIEAERTDKE